MVRRSQWPDGPDKRMIARLLHLARDGRDRAQVAFQSGRPLRGRLVNIGHMLSGNALASIFALIGLSIAMRALGPAQYGVLALVVSYGRVIERVTRFESWQPLIKYAAGLGSNPNPHELSRLYGFGFRLDASACIVAASSAVVLALVAGPWFHLSSETITLLLIYSVALLFNETGMPTAVLRMAGKFKAIAYTQVAGNAARIALCLIGAHYGLGLIYYCAVWAGCQVLTTAVIFTYAMVELHRRGCGNPIFVSCRGVTKQFPGILRFAWSSNLSMTIRSSANDLDVLVVGWLSDPISAGLYFFAKRFAKAVQQVNVQVQAILYPDVARLWAEKAYRKFLRATSQIQLLLGGGFFVVLLGVLAFGKLMIRYGPGEAYYAALPMLLVQIIAVGITTHAAPSRTALLAMGLQQSILKVVFLATLLFQVLLFVLVPAFGAMGANMAHVVLALVCAVSFDLTMRRGVALARRQKGGSQERGSVLAAAE
jgi:O-antigen/teichoic acid export membrane protein